LRSTPAKIVLGLRDILDAPDVIRRRWRREGAYTTVEEHYDRVLVYGSRAVFDVAEQYAWNASAAELLVYCGYVCAPLTPRRTRRIRTKYLNGLAAHPPGNGHRERTKPTPSTPRLVVAMAGGGADGYPLMRALLDALPRMNRVHPSALLLVTGPFMPPDQRRDLQTRAEGVPARVRETVKDVPSYIAAADVVVGMAGYNTTAEILSIGTRAILVPRAAPSAEQRMRARLFRERGWVDVVDPDDLSPETIGDAVISALSTDPTVTDGPDLGGLDVAVAQLLDLLEPEATGASAPAALAEV
jgi:predicted glycosyltransferase